MEKEFCPYEQSLALKELGFDESCFGYYVNNELRGINLGIEELGGKEPYYQRFGFHTISNHDIDNPNKIVVTAPLYQQAFTFFREKHSLQHEIVYDLSDDLINRVYVYTIFGTDRSEEYKTYEEAELACLIKLIEMI
jgi:hypothetical protein